VHGRNIRDPMHYTVEVRKWCGNGAEIIIALRGGGKSVVRGAVIYSNRTTTTTTQCGNTFRTSHFSFRTTAKRVHISHVFLAAGVSWSS